MLLTCQPYSYTAGSQYCQSRVRTWASKLMAHSHASFLCLLLFSSDTFPHWLRQTPSSSPGVWYWLSYTSKMSVTDLQSLLSTLGVWYWLTDTSFHWRCLVMPDNYFHFRCLLLNFRLLLPLQVSVTDWLAAAEMTLVVQYTSNRRLYVAGTMGTLYAFYAT